MKVYELVTFTNPLDFSEQSRQVKFGLFKTPEAAETRYLKLISEDKDWFYRYKKEYQIRGLKVHE
jgi:hypothetical protein